MSEIGALKAFVSCHGQVRGEEDYEDCNAITGRHDGKCNCGQVEASAELDALLAENAQLKDYIKRLEDGWLVYETISPDGNLRPSLSSLLADNAQLRADLDEAIRVMENVVKVHPYFFEVGVWNAASAFLSRMEHEEKTTIPDTMITCSKCGLYHSIYDKECPPF